MMNGSNSITYMPSSTAPKMIENAVANLITLAADKGMRGHKLDNLINKIDDINQLMNMYDNEYGQLLSL